MSSSPDGILLIKNGTLIDSTGGRPRSNGRIEIRGAKIAEVGPEAVFNQRDGARVIDADVNVKAMAAAKARGIRLLLGTDSGNAAVMTPGKWHGYEATFFVRYLGYTPLEAIVLQTRENALAMGLQGQLGTIEPGMIADIVTSTLIPAKTSRCWATRRMFVRSSRTVNRSISLRSAAVLNIR